MLSLVDPESVTTHAIADRSPARALHTLAERNDAALISRRFDAPRPRRSRAARKHCRPPAAPRAVPGGDRAARLPQTQPGAHGNHRGRLRRLRGVARRSERCLGDCALSRGPVPCSARIRRLMGRDPRANGHRAQLRVGSPLAREASARGSGTAGRRATGGDCGRRPVPARPSGPRTRHPVRRRRPPGTGRTQARSARCCGAAFRASSSATPRARSLSSRTAPVPRSASCSLSRACSTKREPPAHIPLSAP
jgi:hypothetical protein